MRQDVEPPGRPRRALPVLGESRSCPTGREIEPPSPADRSATVPRSRLSDDGLDEMTVADCGRHQRATAGTPHRVSRRGAATQPQTLDPEHLLLHAQWLPASDSTSRGRHRHRRKRVCIDRLVRTGHLCRRAQLSHLHLSVASRTFHIPVKNPERPVEAFGWARTSPRMTATFQRRSCAEKPGLDAPCRLRRPLVVLGPRPDSKSLSVDADIDYLERSHRRSVCRRRRKCPTSLLLGAMRSLCGHRGEPAISDGRPVLLAS